MLRRLPIHLVFVVILLAVTGIAFAQRDNEPSANDAAPRVRIAHLAPFAADVGDTAVAITVNGEEILTDFMYTDFTDYVTLPGAGDIDVAILVEGSPVIEETLTVAEDTDYTVAAIGDGSNQSLELWVQVDDNTPPASGEGRVRIAHAAPFGDSAATTAVDICTQEGDVVAGLVNIPYMAESGYISLPAGPYDFRIAAHDPGTPCAGATIIDPLPVMLAEGNVATLFAIGDAVNQPPGLLAIPGGLLATAAVRINHLAPFAMNPADTAVSVELEGEVILEDFQFTDFTDSYLPLPYAGDYDIAIFAGEDEALSDTLTVEAGKGYSVSAIGGSKGWPLELLVLEDDNTAPGAGNARLRIAHTAPFAADLADTQVDVCTQDGTLIDGLAAVPYKVASGYLEIPAGTYDLKITFADPTPCAGLAVIDPSPVTLPEDAVLTVYAFGDGMNQATGLLAVPLGVLDVVPPLVQVVHVAPFAPVIADTAVTLAVNGQALPGQLFYLQNTEYTPLPLAGSYLFEALVDGQVAIADTVDVGAGEPVTIAAIGDGTNQPVEFLVLNDDISPPDPGNAKIRIVHAAPFAADINATRVDICTQNGDPIPGLTGLPYGADTGYLALPAGSYDLLVTAATATPCTGDVIFDTPPIDLPDGAIATVFAVGGANGQMPGAYIPGIGQIGIPYVIYMPVIRG